MSDAGQGEKKGVGWIVLSYLNVGFYLSIDEGFIYADITLTKVGFSRMMQSCHIQLILEKLHAL